jgi:hypothetical protein
MLPLPPLPPLLPPPPRCHRRGARHAAAATAKLPPPPHPTHQLENLPYWHPCLRPGMPGRNTSDCHFSPPSHFFFVQKQLK